jgi:protoporphyrinogen oxidase
MDSERDLAESREPDTDRVSTDEHEIVVIGAGPAGLTAAYMLGKRGVNSTILEADSVVGGISRTARGGDWRFDIGGHRFFTKVQPVEDLWFEILGPEDFLRRPRLSRIYYRGKFYDYPLSGMNVLRNLGPVEAVRSIGSYAWARVNPPKDMSTLEGFVVSRFGWRLYSHFFKTQSEKVWGVPCTEIQADWGAQRIKNLSLVRAIWDALLPKKLKAKLSKGQQVTSLIEEFNYPKYGPGMMWERCTEIVAEQGSRVEMNTEVVGIETKDGKAVAVLASKDGVTERFECTDVVSSMPIGALVRSFNPPPPEEVIKAADALRYRDFITVALVVPEEVGFPDNWIYINDSSVEVGRIQNFGQWSPYLVKDGKTCLGLEFFVWEGGDTWNRSDEDLIAQGAREMNEIGLLPDPSVVEEAYVVRIPKAYPMYDQAYKDNVDLLAAWLAENAPNVHPVGRNGMHRYNNQDHSMLTAMLSVENIFGADHDVWNVNVDEEYHEEKAAAAPPHPNQ